MAAPFTVDRSRRPAIWLGLGLAASTAAIYFAYTPFDDWSYLRFLLPAITIATVLMAVALSSLAFALAGRRSSVWAYPLVALTLLLAFNGVSVARQRLAFQMSALEQRYRSAGMVVRDRLPPSAVVLTTWDSGAVRFHSRREAVVWDALDPEWLDRALDWLSQHGHPPFIMVESWEEPRFRARFAGHAASGNLDWPARYEVDRVVRIYDPRDREKFLSGQRIVTDYIWPLAKR
jgi:hypothetical protein